MREICCTLSYNFDMSCCISSSSSCVILEAFGGLIGVDFFYLFFSKEFWNQIMIYMLHYALWITSKWFLKQTFYNLKNTHLFLFLRAWFWAYWSSWTWYCCIYVISVSQGLNLCLEVAFCVFFLTSQVRLILDSSR